MGFCESGKSGCPFWGETGWDGVAWGLSLTSVLCALLPHAPGVICGSILGSVTLPAIKGKVLSSIIRKYIYMHQ